jgi:DNA damage-binding protein 1
MSSNGYGSQYGSLPTIDVSGRFADSEEEEEPQSTASDSFKSIIFGGIDGMLTTFIIICGAAGGQMNWNLTLILGLAAVFANGLNVGCGEFLSSKAHRYYYIL